MSKRMVFAKGPGKTATPASKALFRKIKKYFAGYSLTAPIRIYFNQGRNRYPDRIKILHVRPCYYFGLTLELDRWEYVQGIYVWKADWRLSFQEPDGNESMLLFLRLVRQRIVCPECHSGNVMQFDDLRCWCSACDAIIPLPPAPQDPKIKRHFRAATM